MLRKPGSLDSVLASGAAGRVGRSDYGSVLDPLVHAMAAGRGEVRFARVLGDAFEGYPAGAGWEDAKIGLSAWSTWTRCGIAMNPGRVHRSISMSGWMMPGEVTVSGPYQVAASIRWAAA